MNFNIEKRTPNSGWVAIHRNIERDLAIYMLADFAKAHDNNIAKDETKRSQLSADGLELAAYDGGDLIEYRALPTRSE